MAELIYLEGVEGSGKSTLCLQLQRTWTGPSACIHLARRYSSAKVLMDQVLDLARILPDDFLIVVDRCWLTDIMYHDTIDRVPEWSYNPRAWQPAMNASEMEEEVSKLGIMVLLNKSHYEPDRLTKMGIRVGQEQESYNRVASERWIRMEAPSAEEVLGLLA